MMAGLARAVWLVPALVVFGVGWWATGRIDSWHAAHRGEIDASLMVRFNWAESAWVHRVIDWAGFALRYVIGGSLALALGAAGVTMGAGAVAAARWVRRALNPMTLVVVAALELVFIILPWRHLYWRPKGIPATRAEAVFVGAKLFTIAILTAIGWVLLLRTAVGAAAESPPPGAPAPDVRSPAATPTHGPANSTTP
jgi:hypothetical protein